MVFVWKLFVFDSLYVYCLLKDGQSLTIKSIVTLDYKLTQCLFIRDEF